MKAADGDSEDRIHGRQSYRDGRRFTTASFVWAIPALRLAGGRQGGLDGAADGFAVEDVEPAGDDDDRST
jgi:hypothetical protein